MLRGHDPDKLSNLTAIEKLTYRLFMERHYEEEAARYAAMFQK
ncbi:hypothetical protein [Paenibacillus sp. ACRRX]|nr:hypothetical protein [Paenibacillus sp. ACRRX]